MPHMISSEEKETRRVCVASNTFKTTPDRNFIWRESPCYLRTRIIILDGEKKIV